MPDRNLVITATIAQDANGDTNTVDLSADVLGAHLPPEWELRLVAAQVDPSVWNTEIADRVLTGHRYRRTEPWYDSTKDTGRPSLSARVQRIGGAS